MKRLLLTVFILISSAASARNGIVRENFQGVRPTGMGNAFVALADDANALWYNPAALVYNKGVHFNLFDTSLGVDSAGTLDRLRSAVFDGNFDNLVNDDTTYVRFNVKPTLITPYFGLSVYTNANGFFEIQNLSLPEVDVYAFNDLAAIAGFGLPLGENFSIGMSVRLIQRSGVDAHLTVYDLLDQLGGISQEAFLDAAYRELKTMMGMGYGIGLNLGAMARIPLGQKRGKGPRLQLAATVEDAGQTTFRSFGSTAPPPPIRPTYNAGMALVYDAGKDAVVNITFDVRHMFEPEPFVKTAHFGLEYRHKFFALRAGAHQLYPTFGASFELLPHTRVHFSTFASELGTSVHERSQRWYTLQAVVGFNPF